MQINIKNIPFDDPKTWDLICAGQTTGVFQCESGLVQHQLKKIKPRNLWELSTVIALVRPGPLKSGYAEKYVENKENPDLVESWGHSVIDDVLKSTHNVACIEENSLIQLRNGTSLPLKDVMVGEEIKSLDVESFTIENDIVIDKIKSQKTEGVEITLSNKRKLTLTKDHRLFTNNGWKRFDEINLENDYVACPNNINLEDRSDTLDTISLGDPIKIAYLLGFLLGDGHCRASSVTISAGTEECCNLLQNWIENNTTLKTKKYFNLRCWYLSVHGHRIWERLTNIRQLLRDTNLDQKDCYTKYIDKSLFNNSLAFQRSLLAGIFDSDGHVSSNGFHITSVSEELRLGISQLLLNSGIVHSFAPNRIHIQDGVKFKELIEPYLIIKTNKHYPFTGLISRRLPKKFVKNSMKRLGQTQKLYPKEYNSVYSKWVDVSKKVYSRLGIDFGDIDFYKIIDTKEVSGKVFYDITTKYNSNFLANNIVVHNCYQESLMHLGSRLAWSHLPDIERANKVDALRKAVGKKNQEKILKIGKEFVEGCLHNKVEQELADKLFEFIKNAGRYAFNLSHSIKYARIGYETAYLKANYPKQFFAGYLSYAEDKKKKKWDEISELCKDTKNFDLEVAAPNINLRNPDFKICGDKIIYGLSHMKFGPSKSVIQKIQSDIKIDSLSKFIKLIFTKSLGTKLRSNTAEALIMTGAFLDVGYSRTTLYNLYKLIEKFSDKELEHLVEFLDKEDVTSISRLQELFNLVVKEAMSKRQPILDSFIKLFKTENFDNPLVVVQNEKKFLGASITAHPLHSINTIDYDLCRELANESAYPKYTKKSVGVVIDFVKETTTKKGDNPGQKMAIVTVSDESGELKIPFFPEQYATYSDILMERNMIQIDLFKGNTGWVPNRVIKL